MFDKTLFKYYREKKGVTIERLANELGINPATLNRKINGESDFYRSEIIAIKYILDLSNEEMMSIFFAQKIA